MFREKITKFTIQSEAEGDHTLLGAPGTVNTPLVEDVGTTPLQKQEQQQQTQQNQKKQLPTHSLLKQQLHQEKQKQFQKLQKQLPTQLLLKQQLHQERQKQFQKLLKQLPTQLLLKQQLQQEKQKQFQKIQKQLPTQLLLKQQLQQEKQKQFQKLQKQLPTQPLLKQQLHQEKQQEQQLVQQQLLQQQLLQQQQLVQDLMKEVDIYKNHIQHLQQQLKQQQLQLEENKKLLEEQQQQRPLCSSCGYKIQQKQDENIESEFIEMFRVLSCLWDESSADIKNAEKKNDAKLSIMRHCNLKSVKQVDYKIRQLRSRYRKEKDRIESSKRSGCGTDDVHKPTWQGFYKLDEFLGSTFDGIGPWIYPRQCNLDPYPKMKPVKNPAINNCPKEWQFIHG